MEWSVNYILFKNYQQIFPKIMLNKLTIKFLKDLQKNNNKDWMDAHKAEYLAAKNDYLALVADVLKEMKGFEPEIAENTEPKNCVFRLNRDVRFSANKNPYKDNMGASIKLGGKKSLYAGYYFHLQPGASFVGGGYWMPEAPMLAKLRQEIDYNFEEFKGIVASKKFTDIYVNGLNREDALKTVPKGYDKENPAIQYLQLKHLVAMAPLKDSDFLEKDIAKKIATAFKALKPMLDFMNRTVE
jgi:uncharacterized protein (TIGR02453 family)